MTDEARKLWEHVDGTHFQELARVARRPIHATDGARHPFPIRTMAGCVMASGPCPDTDEVIGEILEFARQSVKRVLASITDPSYRQTYLTLPEVRHVLD